MGKKLNERKKSINVLDIPNRTFKIYGFTNLISVENISERTAGGTTYRIKYANRNSNNNYFKISRNIHEYLPNIRHLVEGA
jgi:hypothetical protein